MRISNAGWDFIKTHEGLRLKAYKCQAGIWTIGYGHTQGVKENDTISELEASALLLADLEEVFKAVNTIPNLCQCQFDALCSLTYNISKKSFMVSKLRFLALENPSDLRIQNEFLRWVYVTKDGKKTYSQGLLRRRIDEACLYFSYLNDNTYGI